MKDLNLDVSENIIKQATNVERYQANDKYTEIYEMYLTNENLILVYEKTNAILKPENVVEKIPLVNVKINEEKVQIYKVDDNDYGQAMQIVYNDGSKDLFIFNDNKDIDVWKDEISNIILESDDNNSKKNTILEDKKKKSENETKTKTTKCPNCGASIKSFESQCPFCGSEIRNIEASSNLKDFSIGLEKIISKELPKYHTEDSLLKKVIGKDFRNDEEKAEFERKAKKEKEIASYIKNYPVSNSREDLLEFMILSASNIDLKESMDDIIQKAWIDKMSQIYKKASITMSNSKDFKEIEDIYNKKMKEIKNKKVLNNMFFPFLIAMYIILVVFIENYFWGISLIFILLIICLFIFYKIKKDDIKFLKNNYKLIYIICIIMFIISLVFGVIGIKHNNDSNYNLNEENYYNESVQKNDIEIDIDFEENLLFNRYDVELSVYDQKATLLHGESKTINFQLPDGTHTLKFENLDENTIDRIDLVVKGDTKVKYKISCHSDEIEIRELSVEYLDNNDKNNEDLNIDEKDESLGDEEQDNEVIAIPFTSEEYIGIKYKIVEEKIRNVGFENIVLEKKETTDSNNKNETVAEISINGNNWQNGDIFNKKDEVKIVYWELKTSTLDKIVLPKENSKLEKDYDDTMSSNKTRYYFNVDGVKNIPKLEKYENVVVTDGINEYFKYLKQLGYEIEITNNTKKEIQTGIIYETYFKAYSDSISWTMYSSIQDDKYIEYEFDINMQ